MTRKYVKVAAPSTNLAQTVGLVTVFKFFA